MRGWFDPEPTEDALTDVPPLGPTVDPSRDNNALCRSAGG